MTEGTDDYAVFARCYDLLLSFLLDPIRRDLCRTLLASGPGRVLDICCGTGRQLIMLERLGFEAAGVDSSPSMLAVARRKSPAGIAYFRGDAAGLPFADASFDAAVISLALHEQQPEARQAVFGEARRVVKPGGSLLLIDYLPQGRSKAARSLRVSSLVERLAGGEHFRNYREFLAGGGLLGFLAGQGAAGEILNIYLGEAVALVRVDGPDRP